MNLGQIETNDFLPPLVSPQAKGTGLPVVTGIRNWRAIKAQCPLSSSRPSRGDPFPAVFVMEAAENRARRDPAVLGEGMSIVTLPRQECRRRFRNPWSEAQMGAPLVVMSHPLCHDSAQMFLSQRNHEIQTLPAYASN